MLASFRRRLRDNFLGECDRRSQQVPFDKAIENAATQRVFRNDRGTQRAHFDSFRYAGKSRQALRSTSARNYSEFYFRLADLRAAQRNAVVFFFNETATT